MPGDGWRKLDAAPPVGPDEATGVPRCGILLLPRIRPSAGTCVRCHAGVPAARRDLGPVPHGRLAARFPSTAVCDPRRRVVGSHACPRAALGSAGPGSTAAVTPTHQMTLRASSPRGGEVFTLGHRTTARAEILLECPPHGAAGPNERVLPTMPIPPRPPDLPLERERMIGDLRDLLTSVERHAPRVEWGAARPIARDAVAPKREALARLERLRKTLGEGR